MQRLSSKRMRQIEIYVQMCPGEDYCIVVETLVLIFEKFSLEVKKSCNYCSLFEIINSLSFWDRVYSNIITSSCTLTGRCTLRLHSCSLTSASIISYQVEACITTVDGCLFKCCSCSVTNLAIDWISQIATIHNCRKNTSCYSSLYFNYSSKLQLWNLQLSFGNVSGYSNGTGEKQ